MKLENAGCEDKCNITLKVDVAEFLQSPFAFVLSIILHVPSEITIFEFPFSDLSNMLYLSASSDTREHRTCLKDEVDPLYLSHLLSEI